MGNFVGQANAKLLPTSAFRSFANLASLRDIFPHVGKLHQ
jgi:hypothetical protein